MIDRWFRVIRLPITIEQWETLPTNPAYKYEYLGDYALLSPRPKSYHALLDLRPAEVPQAIDARSPVRIRPLTEADWGRLPPVFANAFHRVQPFASLDDEERLRAAADCLRHTRDGGDGPRIDPACFVAETVEDGPHLVGASLLTFPRPGRLDPFEDETAPGGEPLPHLTWIFVNPWVARHGVGAALLAASGNALLADGHRTLASTFLLGNESSMLWHWRSGFRLLSYLGSPGRYRRRRPDPPAEPRPEGS